MNRSVVLLWLVSGFVFLLVIPFIWLAPFLGMMGSTAIIASVILVGFVCRNPGPMPTRCSQWRRTPAVIATACCLFPAVYFFWIALWILPSGDFSAVDAAVPCIIATVAVFVRGGSGAVIQRGEAARKWSAVSLVISLCGIIVLPQVLPGAAKIPADFLLAAIWVPALLGKEVFHAIALLRTVRVKLPLALSLVPPAICYCLIAHHMLWHANCTDSVVIAPGVIGGAAGPPVMAVSCVALPDGGAAVGIVPREPGGRPQLVVFDAELNEKERHDLAIIPNVIKARGSFVFIFNGTPGGFSSAMIKRGDPASLPIALPREFRTFPVCGDVPFPGTVIGWIGPAGQWPRQIVVIDPDTGDAEEWFLSKDLIAGLQTGRETLRWLSLRDGTAIITESRKDVGDKNVYRVDIGDIDEIRPSHDLSKLLINRRGKWPEVIDLRQGRRWYLPAPMNKNCTPVFANDCVAVNPWGRGGWEIYRLSKGSSVAERVPGLPGGAAAPSFGAAGRHFLIGVEDPASTRSRLFMGDLATGDVRPLFPDYGVDVPTLALAQGRNWHFGRQAYYVTLPTARRPNARLVKIRFE